VRARPQREKASRRKQKTARRRLAEYIDQVIAIAATELAVVVSEPLPPHLRPQRKRARALEQGDVDQETGEISPPATKALALQGEPA